MPRINTGQLRSGERHGEGMTGTRRIPWKSSGNGKKCCITPRIFLGDGWGCRQNLAEMVWGGHETLRERLGMEINMRPRRPTKIGVRAKKHEAWGLPVRRKLRIVIRKSLQFERAVKADKKRKLKLKTSNAICKN